MQRQHNFRDALVLAVVAPTVAEAVASSNTPGFLYPLVLPLLVLIYGIPALLIREAWMRDRIGVPGFLLLGLLYSALNEGVIAATWFKLTPPDDKVLVFSAEHAGRVNGANLALITNLTVYHTIWSMLIPIVLVEAWTTRPRNRPWMPGWAVWLSVGVLALIILGSLSRKTTRRVCEASSSTIFDECQRGRWISALVIVVGVPVALALPRWRPSRRAGRRHPTHKALVWVGALYSIAFLIAYFVLPLSGHAYVGVATGIVLLIAASLATVWWWGAPSWTRAAAVRLATGAMIPGMISTIRALLVAQPVIVVLFIWLFLRPTWDRSRRPDTDFESPPLAPPPWSPPT